jgi:hypothetical protein
MTFNDIFIDMDKTVASDLPPKPTLESIQNHAFSYGISTAVNDPSSFLIKEGKQFVLHYTPPTNTDDLWYGDCAADTLLTYKSIAQAGLLQLAKPEYLKVTSPDASYNGTHFRVKVDKDGQTLFLDHSRFYKSIHQSNVTSVGPIEAGITPDIDLISDIELSDQNRNYREFQIEDRNCLTTINMRPIGENSQIQVCIFEQDEQGRIIRRYEVNRIFDQMGNEVNTRRDGSTMFIAHVTESGKGEFKEVKEDRIITETDSTFDELLSAYKRGQNK